MKTNRSKHKIDLINCSSEEYAAFLKLPDAQIQAALDEYADQRLAEMEKKERGEKSGRRAEERKDLRLLWCCD